MPKKPSVTRGTTHILAKEEGANDDNRVKLAVDEDGTIPLSLLQSAFPGAAGLKYWISEENVWVRAHSLSKFLQPMTGDQWHGDRVYVVVWERPTALQTSTVVTTCLPESLPVTTATQRSVREVFLVDRVNILMVFVSALVGFVFGVFNQAVTAAMAKIHEGWLWGARCALIALLLGMVCALICFCQKK